MSLALIILYIPYAILSILFLKIFLNIFSRAEKRRFSVGERLFCLSVLSLLFGSAFLFSPVEFCFSRPAFFFSLHFLRIKIFRAAFYFPSERLFYLIFSIFSDWPPETGQKSQNQIRVDNYSSRTGGRRTSGRTC